MFQDKVQALVSKQKEKGSKKNIENLIVLIVILIITIIAINTIWKEDDKSNINIDNNATKTLADELGESKNETFEENELERRIENILQKIDGVGKVSVLITYSQTSEIIAMYNENVKQSSTEETDTGGGTRKIEEIDNSKEIIYKDQNGEKIPMTQKVILPRIEGAIITAEGAKNATIKTNIIQAVEAATGLAAHKIQVFTMQS